MASEEVMVAQNQGIGQKITQVAILLQTQKEVTISAINLAIPAAISLVELIKHKVKGLHQQNSFERVPDSTKTRLKIKLSFNLLNAADKGYQAPLPIDQVQEKSLEDLKKVPVRTDDRPNSGRRGRGFRQRGGDRTRGEGRTEDRPDVSEGLKRGEERGIGDGRRSRRFRGRGFRRGELGAREEFGARGERRPWVDRRGRRGARFERGREGRRRFGRGREESGRRDEGNVEAPSHISAGDPWASAYS